MSLLSFLILTTDRDTIRNISIFIVSEMPVGCQRTLVPNCAHCSLHADIMIILDEEFDVCVKGMRSSAYIASNGSENHFRHEKWNDDEKLGIWFIHVFVFGQVKGTQLERSRTRWTKDLFISTICKQIAVFQNKFLVGRFSSEMTWPVDHPLRVCDNVWNATLNETGGKWETTNQITS